MKNSLLLLLATVILTSAHAQPVGMEVGQVLIVNFPTVKDGSDKAIKALFTDVSSNWAKGQPGISLAHFMADRGKNKGGHMLVCSIRSIEERKKFPGGTPFTGSKAY